MTKLLDFMFDLPVEDTGGCTKHCGHKDCPVWDVEADEPGWCEKSDIIKVNRADKVTKCHWRKPVALSLWNFIARMGVCASLIACVLTVFQVPLWATIALGCSFVAFWQWWRWLEKEGKKW